MSSYLREMNPKVWWMVDIGLSYILEDCPQTQRQKKWLYLESHASNTLSSDLTAEIKDEIEIEYDWFERANLLWNVLEQMYDSSNSKKSSLIALKNISSSSTLFYQSQKGNQVLKKKKQNLSVWENWTVRFSKPDYPILAE
jgi:hypothetical protein